MNQFRNYQPQLTAHKIVQFCVSNNRKFVFLSGNGGAGKTELSKAIAKEAEKYGFSNVLDMDDFVVDTKLRESATITWDDPENGQQSGRYTTSFEASYFLQNIKAILFNIEKGNNYYHWPKKAKESSECKLLHGNAVLTIIDGTGTVFLNRNDNNAISIFMKCSKELEIDRRIKRGRFSNEKNEEEVRRKFAERNSQYRAIIEPHISEFGLILESLEDFSLKVIQDRYDILS